MSANFMNDGKSFEILQKFSLSISVADESVPEENSCLSGNVLIETSPMIFNIKMSIMESLTARLDEIVRFPIFSREPKPENESETKIDNHKTLAIIQESSKVPSEIKDFLGLATASAMTKVSFTEKADKKKITSKCNLYGQRICSKITLNLLDEKSDNEKKLCLEVVKVLLSLHHQRDFYQLKSEISSISASYF